MRVLLITPPLVQCNTPYPAMPMLAAWLRRRGHTAVQADLSLALILRVFSRRGWEAILAALDRRHPGGWRAPPSVRHVLAHRETTLRRLTSAVRFLQGRHPDAAARFARPGFLPEGPCFAALDEESVAAWPVAEQARHRASLFLDDLAAAVHDGLDPRFAFARYAEQLAAAAPAFDDLADALRAPPSLLDRWVDDLTVRSWRRHRPEVVGLTVPFPGAVYGAFRIARRLKRLEPALPIVFGGGYVNTELRALDDPRIFDFADYLMFDDGERPFERLLAHVSGRAPAVALLRTLRRAGGRVERLGFDAAVRARAPDVPHRRKPAPVYDGLRVGDYLPLAESPNPMHRLWSGRCWNKLQLAHGCYWRRCAFCDTSLDYIRRFDPADAATVRRWIRSVLRRTGERGFHFVDEAAPPALLRALADRLIASGPRIEWWANIRFERAFTPDLARRLAASGCVAVTGGIETAGDRLLACMNKGVTLAQAARAARALSSAGILVHAYLMYGFPTQTAQETVDALEYVRQMFAAGCLHSAYWHRFALTVHSPVFQGLETFGVRVSKPWKELAGWALAQDGRGGDAPPPPRPVFAVNEIPFREPRAPDLDRLGAGLRAALYAYQRGQGLDENVRAWFPGRVPRATLPPDAVARWTATSSPA